MRTRSPFLILLLALLSGGTTAAAPAKHPAARKVPLPKAVARILADPGVNQAHWGISVVALSGTPLYSLNDGQYFNPASNAKLLTTAAAYSLLPSGLTFTTLVSSSAPVSQTGEIRGDVTIFGVGDPNMSARTIPFGIKTERTGSPLAALEDMADQIVRHGVHSISGDIVGDDTWFVFERYGAGWSWDDLQWGYGAPASALSVNDNEVYLNAMPAAQVGQPAVASWLPATAYYTLDNSLTTAPPGDPGKPGIERAPGGMTVRLFGRTPLGQQGLHCRFGYRRSCRLCRTGSAGYAPCARGPGQRDRPGATSAIQSKPATFSPQQQQPIVLHPISIQNVQAANVGSFLLASHVSPPLGDDLVVTNKVSQNLHAEITLRTLGKLESSDGSLLEGTRVVRQFLVSAGHCPKRLCALRRLRTLTPGSGHTPGLYHFARLRSTAELGRSIPHFSAGGGSGWLPLRPLQAAIARWQSVRQDRHAGRSTCFERLPGCCQWPDGRLLDHVHRSFSIPARGPHRNGQDRSRDRGGQLKMFSPKMRLLILAFGLLATCGCKQSPSKPVRALTPQEAAGKQVFVNQCSSCHYADTDKGLYGPGLAGLFSKPYLSNGMPANDTRVRAVILHGYAMMPPMGNTMSNQEFEELMAYLHTL